MTPDPTSPSAGPAEPAGAPAAAPALELAALRARLAQGGGPEVWRSLDELA